MTSIVYSTSAASSASRIVSIVDIGDRCEVDGWVIEVLAMHRHTIDAVGLTKRTDATASGSAADEPRGAGPRVGDEPG